MNFDKTGTISFLTKVLEKLKGKWLAAICSSLIIAFLVFMLTDFIELTPIFSVPIIGFVLLGEINFMRKLMTGDDYKLENLFEDYKLFIPAFLTTALLLILLSVGFALLIIPGIIILVNYSFALHILEENKELGALQALRASKDLTKSYRFKIGIFYLAFLILSLLVFGISFAIMLIPNLIWGTALMVMLLYAGILAGVIHTLFITPFFYASITMFYDELKAGKIQKDEKRKTKKEENEQDEEVVEVEAEEV
jgi:uncharacterized membrane protein